MKPVLLALGVLVISLVPPGASATDCRAIVATTLAELKAAYPEWDQSMETLVRTAAGSACVKAAAAVPPAAAASAPQMREQAVRADGEVVPMTPAPATAAATATGVAASDATAVASGTETPAEEDEDSGWNPFKEIKFNKVSASPNKKPYERRREVNKAAPLEDEDEAE